MHRRSSVRIALASAAVLLALVPASSTRAAGPPVVSPNYSAAVDDDRLYFQGHVDPNGSATTYHLAYRRASESSWSELPQRPIAGTSGDQLTAEEWIYNTDPSTDYVLRVVATNASGTTEGSDVMLTTRAAAPLARTGNATEITATSVRVTGYVDPRGNATSWWFDYGPITDSFASSMSGNPTFIAGGNGEVLVEATLNGLQPSTTYHFRLHTAANSEGHPEPGEFVEFTTAPAPPPTPVDETPPPDNQTPQPVAPAPSAPLPTGTAGAAARGRTPAYYCRALSKRRVRGHKRTPFAECVSALRRVNRGNVTPSSACRPLSHRKRRGQRRSDYAACLSAGKLLVRARSRAN